MRHSVKTSSRSSLHTSNQPSGWQRWGATLLIGSGIVTITLLLYLTGISQLPYHSIYRSLYYLPIAGAAVYYGWRGGVFIALVVCLLFIPRSILFGEIHPGEFLDNLLEIPVFILVGGMSGWLADRERQQRQRADALHAYIGSVLQSLPLGVATTDGTTSLIPQNTTANRLLQTVSSHTLTHLNNGYHTIDQVAVPLGIHISPLHDLQGKTQGHVYVLEDLTERRAMETQIRRMDRLASVGQLAAGIAHEIRNPLAILRATSQLLADRLRSDTSLVAYLDVLVGESDRIDRLIGELQDYARPKPPTLEPLGLYDVLKEARDEVYAYALQHDVQVLVYSTDDISFSADRQQIRHLLVNLLFNAIQASSPGTDVHLRGERTARGVRIRVIDTGCGMPSDVQERVCEPFFTTRDEGTGLGLAIVSAVVTQHHGTLHIQSTPGKGTEIRVTLPGERIHEWHES